MKPRNDTVVKKKTAKEPNGNEQTALKYLATAANGRTDTHTHTYSRTDRHTPSRICICVSQGVAQFQ